MAQQDWEDIAKYRYKKDRLLINLFSLENKKYIFSLRIKDNLDLEILCYDKLTVKNNPYMVKKNTKRFSDLNLLKKLFPKNNFDQWIKFMEKIKEEKLANKI